MTHRAYLIEPQLLFVPYLSQVLAHAGLAVVAAAGNVDERELNDNQPAVVMVDVDYTERRELSLIREIRLAVPSASIFAYSDRDDDLFAASCRIAGATALISKNVDEGAFCEQVRRAVIVGA